MRLSEAIRLGAMATPQASMGYMDGEGHCAIAGACVAVGIDGVMSVIEQRLIINYEAAQKRWPILGSGINCPACSDSYHADSTLMMTLWRLNDEHRWTRERIADWLEAIEQRSDDTRTCDAVGLSHESPVAVNAR